MRLRSFVRVWEYGSGMGYRGLGTLRDRPRKGKRTRSEWLGRVDVEIEHESSTMERLERDVRKRRSEPDSTIARSSPPSTSPVNKRNCSGRDPLFEDHRGYVRTCKTTKRKLCLTIHITISLSGPVPAIRTCSHRGVYPSVNCKPAMLETLEAYLEDNSVRDCFCG